jgi:hypothetical protein
MKMKVHSAATLARAGSEARMEVTRTGMPGRVRVRVRVVVRGRYGVRGGGRGRRRGGGRGRRRGGGGGRGRGRGRVGDEDGHAWHALQGAEGAEGADGTDGGVVAEAGDEDGDPRQRDHHKVQLAPGVLEVSLRREDETVGDDLGDELEGEDVQVGPLAVTDEARLICARWVEGRDPRHREAAAQG